jgi:hypothetical protein
MYEDLGIAKAVNVISILSFLPVPFRGIWSLRITYIWWHSPPVNRNAEVLMLLVLYEREKFGIADKSHGYYKSPSQITVTNAVAHPACRKPRGQ